MAISRATEFKEKLEKSGTTVDDIVQTFRMVIVKPGDAVNFPKYRDSVAIHYKCFKEDGTCLDDSRRRGQQLVFVLGSGQVIPAFELIVPLLSKGEKARFVVPPEYGYGDKGYPPIISPNSLILYEIELVNFSSVGHSERLHREKIAKDPYDLAP